MRVWPLLNRRLSRHFQGVLQHPLPSENAAQGRYGRFFLRDLPDSRAAGTHGACRARIRTISGALAVSTATSHSLPYDPAAVEFDPLLPRLDLANTRRRWRELLDRAETHGWSCRACLGMLITKEISHRQQTRIQRSLRQARLPFLKTVEEFDFSFQSRGTTALGTGWSGAGGGLPRGRGGRTADGVAGMRSTSQLRVPRAEHKREHNPVREVIHNVHRIKPPLPRTPTPFYRHLFLRGTGALTITRIHLDLPSGGGPNLPLLTSIEMTPDASAVVTFHRIHWKGSPEYALAPARRSWRGSCSASSSCAASLNGCSSSVPRT